MNSLLYQLCLKKNKKKPAEKHEKKKKTRKKTPCGYTRPRLELFKMALQVADDCQYTSSVTELNKTSHCNVTKPKVTDGLRIGAHWRLIAPGLQWKVRVGLTPIKKPRRSAHRRAPPQISFCRSVKCLDKSWGMKGKLHEAASAC